jgi:hypothetical protein
MKKIAAILLTIAIAACGGKKSEGQSSAKGSDKPAGPVKLAKLNLQADLPPDSRVEDSMMGGEGHTLMLPSGVAIAVDPAKDSQPATLDAEKSDSEMFTPKNAKSETLPDGYVYTFENSGGAGTNYWVAVRRTIGGKAYRCSTTASNAKQQQDAVNACKSLRQ